ncbi:MAG: (4Fe-4S)-binding protein [Bacteroidales bacterium]|nr:(4Fe-4S)-binding protein [Bacteroidales bacterium]
MASYDSDYSGSNDRQYTNGEITVFWKPNKCIHATTCYKELIEVFNPRKRPWVNMNGASTEEIIRVVNLCPTEALTFKYNKNLSEQPVRQILPETENEVRVMRDGPLVIKGNFKVYGPDGTEYKRMKMVSICRCGASLQMPFCDGTHRKIGFTGK